MIYLENNQTPYSIWQKIEKLGNVQTLLVTTIQKINENPNIFNFFTVEKVIWLKWVFDGNLAVGKAEK